MTVNTAQGASAPSEKQLRVRELVKNLNAHIDAVWATSVVIGSGVAADLVEKDRQEALYRGRLRKRKIKHVKPGEVAVAA